MSLHANLTPEALQRLHAQRRNSTVSSVAIAVLAVVLVALTLGIFLLPQLPQAPPTLIYKPTVKVVPPDDPPVARTHTRLKPSAPSPARNRVITSPVTASIAIPTMDVDVSAPSMEFGSGDDIGLDQGNDFETGFDKIPPVIQKRCSKGDRLARLADTGGTPDCEDAVVKALDWFKATQSADGSWTGSHQTAMTGFALLAYLGHCETPRSVDYGDTVLRAMTYLINVGIKNDGKLSTKPTGQSWCYEHAIATYALGEAATFCKQGDINVPNLFEITQKAGQFIIDNQNENGGWAYQYATAGGHTDLSVSAWQIQALKACKLTGLEFKGLGRATRKAMDYVEALQCPDGGFAYAKAGESPHAAGYRTLTGAGVLSLQMWDKGSTSSARRGARYILENTRFDYDGIHSDLYGHYYEAQAMMNRGGKEWRDYNGIFRDQVLDNQNEDGSWKAPNKGEAGIRAVGAQFVGNVHYRTALCTLMLEVYYRFLPATGSH